MNADFHPVSNRLRRLLETHAGDHISIREMADFFRDQDYPLLSFLFALIAAIPIPGAHAILGLPVFFVSVQKLVGRKTIWMPEIVCRQTIQRTTFANGINRALPWIERIEKLCAPRFDSVLQPRGVWALALVATFLSVIILVPGPLTNFVPAVSIAVMALGILMRDGLVAMLGAIGGVVFGVFLILLYFAAISLIIIGVLSWIAQ